MRNQTLVKELYLSGLSNIPALQLPLFLFFLLIYLLTLIWNLLIIVLIVTDSHLHVPMYFYLGILASLDLCSASVTVPRMLFDLLTQRRSITIPACMTQVFFFLLFAASEVFLLSTMSYDRYTAICHPLHYTQMMSWKVCVQLVSCVWCLSLFFALVNTFYALKLTFCESAIVESFFCDLPQLFHISSSDTTINVLLMLSLAGFFAWVTLTLTFLPYVYIFRAVLVIQAKGSRSKTFSTCTSHLTVVSIFYGTGMFDYLKPSTGYRFAGVKILSVFYAVITPLLNPLIYSLRNQEFRKAFQVVLKKTIPKVLQNPS